MNRTLPVCPSLEYLKNQAKALLRAHEQGDAAVYATLRQLGRFARMPDVDILAASISLSEVQYALAMEYGFESWAKLKHHVESARPRPTLQRGQGSAWIEGLPPLVWGQGKDCTFLGSLETALLVTYEPYSYADLMGLSGMAFRVRTRHDLCPSSAVGELPDEYAAIRRTTGWNLPTEVQFGQKGWQHAVAAKMVASIDAGLPVLAYDDHLDMGVVYGYEEGGAVLWYIDYRKGAGLPYRVPPEKIGPLQSYLGRKDAPLPPIEQLKYALELAVQNWGRRVHDGGVAGRAYHYGSAGYDLWIDILQRAAPLPAAEQEGTMHGHRIIFHWLIDARRAAATFLRERADLAAGQARTQMLEAAEACGALANQLDHAQREEKLFHYDRAHPYDTSTATPGQPLSEIRRREIEVLREAKTADGEIIRQVESVLAAMG